MSQINAPALTVASSAHHPAADQTTAQPEPSLPASCLANIGLASMHLPADMRPLIHSFFGGDTPALSCTRNEGEGQPALFSVDSGQIGSDGIELLAAKLGSLGLKDEAAQLLAAGAEACGCTPDNEAQLLEKCLELVSQGARLDTGSMHSVVARATAHHRYGEADFMKYEALLSNPPAEAAELHSDRLIKEALEGARASYATPLGRGSAIQKLNALLYSAARHERNLAKVVATLNQLALEDQIRESPVREAQGALAGSLWKLMLIGDPRRIDLLLRAGVDANVQDPATGQTALVCAVKDRQWDIIDVLLLHGASTACADGEGRQLLHLAAKGGDFEVVQKLLPHAAVNAADAKGLTPLHYACSNGSMNIAEMLIRANADIHARAADGGSPLHVVLTPGLAKKLIEAGASLEAQNTVGATPLHCACSKGKADVAEELILANADIGARTNTAMTALHLASYRGNIRTLKVLVDSGADVMARDVGGDTPLHYACGSGQQAASLWLIERGADIEAIDHRDRTPAAVASERHFDALAAIIDAPLAAYALGLERRPFKPGPKV
jgi:ankyrin repeat protein